MKMLDVKYALELITALTYMPACDFPSDRDLLEIYNHMPAECKNDFKNAMLERGAFTHEYGTVVTTKRGLLISEPGRK